MFSAISLGCDPVYSTTPYAMAADCVIGITALVIAVLAYKNILTLTHSQRYACYAVSSFHLSALLLFATMSLSVMLSGKHEDDTREDGNE